MKRKKLYYVPGMVSLIGIPLLILLFNPKQSKPLNTIRLYLPSDNKSDDGIVKLFSKGNFYKSITNKNIIQVDLNKKYLSQESYLTRARLNFITREIERLKFTNDTTTVLKVNMGDSNTYGQFVWLVDQTLIYQIKKWIFVDNSFYFLNSIPEPIRNDMQVITPIYL